MDEFLRELKDKCLSISTVPEKGRCLFTTRDFSPGELIISEIPYVSVPNKKTESSESRCEWCFSSNSVKKCSACKVVYYCSSSCQKLDWRMHSAECRALSRLGKDRVESVTSSIRLMVRLYLRRKMEISKVYPITAAESYRNIEALVSHFSDVDEKLLVLYAQMANLVSLILQFPEFEIKEIAENFSRLACNAHTICDEELNPLGTGLYPAISIINHSCSPNSVLSFEGRRAMVRALEFIPKGSEVLISYIEIAGSTATRQKALKDQYFFTCTCSRCMHLGQPDDIRESAILEGYRCKDGKCDGYLICVPTGIGFICQSCGSLREQEEIKEMTKEMLLLSDKAATLLSSGDKPEASVAYKLVEDFQMKLYHPFSVILMRTRETLLKIFIELLDWKQAILYCRLTVPVYERVYPGHHPLLGLQHYTCGKIEWFLGETEAAVRSLTKAWDILKINYGTKTAFMIELLAKLEEARAEASYLIHGKNED